MASVSSDRHRRTHRPGIAIFGPTSSGKTLLSLELCHALADRGLRPVVMNADSRQVYIGMDIGTSKIQPNEMEGVEHRLLSIAEPASKLPLEHYVARARQELSGLATSDQVLPILVGGTGVYVQSLVQSWDLDGTASLRRSLQRDFPRGDIDGAYDVLRRLDRAAASRVKPANYEGIINALVRRMATDSVREPSGEPFRFAVFGIDRGARATDRRIAATLDRQLARGLVDEIVTLDERFGLVEQMRRRLPRGENAVLATHGYREFVGRAAHVSRDISGLTHEDIQAARADALGHIVAYSRRQRAWFPKLAAIPVDHSSGVSQMLKRISR